MTFTPGDGGGGDDKGTQVPFLEAMMVPMKDKIRGLARERGMSEEDTRKLLQAGLEVSAKHGFSPIAFALSSGAISVELAQKLQEAKVDAPFDLVGSTVNAIMGFLWAAIMFGADNLATGFQAVARSLPVAVSALARGLQALCRQMGFGDLADNIDTTGDPLAFFGSITDIIIDERRLTQGPLDIKALLQYENRLQGIRMAVVLVSFVFSVVVEIASLGQVEGFIGLLLHMVDEVVADASRVVSTQLVRKAVADPFTDFYTQIHRTKDASPSELEAAFKEGLVGDEEIVAGLAKNGYTDEAIQLKVGLARAARLYNVGLQPARTKPAPPSVIQDAVKAGWIFPEEGLRELALQGLNDTALAIYWNRFARDLAIKPSPLPGPFPGPGEGEVGG